MQTLLEHLAPLPIALQLLLFFVENVLVLAGALLLGHLLLVKQGIPIGKASQKDMRIASITVLLNTLITQAGFMLWQYGYIQIDFSFSYTFFIDTLIVFFAMDFFMFLFHWGVHFTFLYKYVHTLHHEAVHPKPVDLFVLHPLETMGFGVIWLGLLSLYTFHIGAIVVFLTLNVVLGIISHLGTNLQESTPQRSKGVLQYFGNARFHHQHHLNEQVNFGFFTNIWDRVFSTYVR
ncbi:sterol desaturase family protein [Chitinophaga skermanii]|nr:sterol desaturase family protein [Chitinophaga skermanii]